MATKSLNVFIHSLDGTGHLNACIGLGQTVQERGHKVTFLINEAFKGQTSIFGFREIHLKDKPKPPPENAAPTTDSTENPIKAVAEQLLTSGLLSGKNSMEKLKLMENANFMEDMYERCVIFNAQLEEAIQKEKPDLIIVDHFMLPPAILQANIPYVLIYSGNPLMLYKSKLLPPPCSGYATNSDPATWGEFLTVFERGFCKQIQDFQVRLNAACNYEPPAVAAKADEVFSFPESPFLNIYGYPEELDYHDVVPRGDHLFQIDAFCRKMPEPFKLPEELHVQPGDKLIYVSMGSMGSIDVKLNKRIASVLAKTPYKCIFSKGPLASEYELPPNCWGEAFVPQTSILPLVDLVITHGGNNSVTETFSFGKPMIVLPLFADQWDNAQRLQEKGLGIRLETYDFEEQQMLDAVEKLMNDKALNERLKAAARRIETSQSKVKACQRMEQIVEQFQQKQ